MTVEDFSAKGSLETTDLQLAAAGEVLLSSALTLLATLDAEQSATMMDEWIAVALEQGYPVVDIVVFESLKHLFLEHEELLASELNLRLVMKDEAALKKFNKEIAVARKLYNITEEGV